MKEIEAGKTRFIIDHIDPLGQGVSKQGSQVNFVGKTLPGEAGICVTKKSKKNLSWSQVIEIETPSPQRITPKCVHFDQCTSCHFLHTSYDEEIKFKLTTLSRLTHFEHDKINLIKSKRRFHYRNRVQLHYNKNEQKIGQRCNLTHRIIDISKCIILRPELQKAFDDLYKRPPWDKLENEKGHIEIYFIDGQTHLSFDHPYAKQGFTQVHEEMNIKLQNLVLELSQHTQGKVLDLFGGSGNLSQKLNRETIIIDYYDHKDRIINDGKRKFIHGDLFKTSVHEFMSRISKSKLIIVDPPRSGFKGIEKWAKELNKPPIIYVSCDPHTFTRDFKSLQNIGYNIQSLNLIDLFPGTFHFETVALISL